MSIVRWTEHWDQRALNVTPTLTITEVAANNAFGVAKYHRRWRIVTDTHTDGPAIISADVRWPNIYDPYVEANGITDPTALCAQVSLRADAADPKCWWLDADYASNLLPNPFSRPVEIEFDFAPYQKAVFEDINGKAVVNTAGDPYDPPATKDDSRPVLKVTRNEPVPGDMSVAILYQDAINSDVWFGAQPGQAKIAKIGVRRQYDSLIPYVVASYEIHFRNEGWDLILLNAGFHVIDINNNLVLARDPVDGAPLANPVLLDANGKQLNVNLGQQPVYNHFTVYNSLAFNDLLPLS